MRLNVDSAVHVLQAAAPHLLERRSGSVINVSSVAGLSATPAMAQYGASKAALISLTRTLAVEWASTGVRVNALCPGWTATELNRSLWENEDVYAGLTSTIPMGRWARAEEMAGPALFLASDASSFMTGQTLVVDGGQTAGLSPGGAGSRSRARHRLAGCATSRSDSPVSSCPPSASGATTSAARSTGPPPARRWTRPSTPV